MRVFPNPRVNMFPATTFVAPGDDVVWTDHATPEEIKNGAQRHTYEGKVVSVDHDHAIVSYGRRITRRSGLKALLDKTGEIYYVEVDPLATDGDPEPGDLVRVEDPRKSYWFTAPPTKIFEYHLGLPPINRGKFRDLLDFADTSIDLWHYLASLTARREELTDDIVNFILGPLAAALKERSGNPEKGGTILGFRDREQIVAEDGLIEMFTAIKLGLVPKSVRKSLDAFMVQEFNQKVLESSADWRHWAVREVFYTKLSELLEDVLEAASVDIGAIVDKVLADNPAQAEKIKDDPKLIGWMMGQVMKASPTKLDPNEVRAVITSRL